MARLSSAEDVVAALRAGEPVLLPTDTVYGLCALPAAARALSRLKGRDEGRPLALLAAGLEALVERLPELDERSLAVARALLPGPFTLVLPNPARRLPELTGSRPETIGVRVVDPPTGDARAVLAAVGAVAATSANLTGGPDPPTLDRVPAPLREACAAELDAGELPGTPSTVLDLTGPEPAVLREGAVPAAEALQRVARALR